MIWHSFRVVGMTARLMLAAFAWNCRLQHVQQDPKTPSVIWSRRRKCWVCRTRSEPAACTRTFRCWWTGWLWRQLPRITRPQHIEGLGAQVPRLSLGELIDMETDHAWVSSWQETNGYSWARGKRVNHKSAYPRRKVYVPNQAVAILTPSTAYILEYSWIH